MANAKRRSTKRAPQRSRPPLGFERFIEAAREQGKLDIDPVRASVERATSAMLVAAGVKKEAPVKELKGKRRKRSA